MENKVQTVAKQAPKDGVVTFIPFGSKEEIKLSVEIVKNFVAIPTKSGATCDSRQAMRFIMLCLAQHLNPFAGDAFLTGYDSQKGPQFSLITAHVAFLKRAEVAPQFDGMESGVILQAEDGTISEREGDFFLPPEKVVGGWAKVYRKDRKPTYRRLSVASMKPSYETRFWDEMHAPGQIVKCAEADALRSTFPTLLGGLYNEGEAERMPTIDITSSPAGLVATRKQVEDSGGTEAQVQSETVQPEKSGNIGERAQVQNLNADQKELEALVLANGFTFGHLQTWGEDSANIPSATSLASFDDIPSDICKRLLKAKTGLLKGLAQVKGGAA